MGNETDRSRGETLEPKSRPAFPGEREVREARRAAPQNQIRVSGISPDQARVHFYDLFMPARAVPSTNLPWRSVTDPEPQKPILVALGSDAQALTLTDEGSVLPTITGRRDTNVIL